MQTNQKKIGILLIIAGLIIIFLIIYFVFMEKTSSPGEETAVTPENSGQLPEASDNGTTTPSDQPRNYQKYNIDQEMPHKIGADDLGKISMAFASRFGSYSNQSDYGNFTDLKILMTDSMKEWVDGYVAKLRGQASGGGAYYGVVTEALTYEVKSFDDAAGQAEIIVSTQRRESTEKIAGGEPYIQNLDLTMKKVNGDWLFAEAYWEK